MKSFILPILMILFFNIAGFSQMLSKETGAPLAPNQRSAAPPVTKVVLPNQKFDAIPNKIVEIQNATPTSGKTCAMQTGGTFQYLIQYDSTRALMIYTHPKAAFPACKSGTSFLMPIDDLFAQKRVVEPNALEIKKRLIRRNMQGN